MALTDSPRRVAAELNQRPPGSQCRGAHPRHHYVYRVVAGGAEPVCCWECAHCTRRASKWIEVALTEAEARAKEEQSMAGHREHCMSARPEIRPTSGAARRAPARRLAGRR